MKNSPIKLISIIIPVYNEAKNLLPLFERIDDSVGKNYSYELIIIDDHSSDATAQTALNLSKKYPVKYELKKGKKGKSYSLIQGFEKAKGSAVVMIDADLQYPPEAIVPMIQKLDTCEIVISNRKQYRSSVLRKMMNKVFKFGFGRVLYNLNFDIQSGLKVFRREVIDAIHFTPYSAWSFDLEFIHRAREAGFEIKGFDIDFGLRQNGVSQIHFISNSIEVAFHAIQLRLKKIRPVLLSPDQTSSMQGAGIGYQKKRYITHTTLPYQMSALQTFVTTQKLLIALFFILILDGFLVNGLVTLQVIVGVLSFIYFVDVLFNLFIILRSILSPQEIQIADVALHHLPDYKLPIYTILCPLYKEAHVVPQFLNSISKLEYPSSKLDVILLLEEDDIETIEITRAMKLPSYVRIVVVPDSQPKTKPKACNYGLSFAKGEYLVIYDAEDIPDPKQLKKAYSAFQIVPKNVLCLQAKLNYYNSNQNVLTRFFTSEYSLWFDLTLTGLQSINTSIPLGGTSNHFRTIDLLKLQGWDPFNVTEDADLGIRLFKEGYRTAIIDSTTLEEANSKWGNWLRQRSRWIKGYMQTYLVHIRDTWNLHKKNGIHAFLFHLVIGGKIAFIFINPILWLATISYFVLYQYVGPTIEALYPSYIFYMAVISLLFGNFLFVYYYMIGCIKREQWGLIKYVFFIPFYWIMISIAGFIALYQLLFKPHYWEKTVHGLHLKTQPRPKPAPVALVSKTVDVLQKKDLISNKQQNKTNRFWEQLSDPIIARGGLLIIATVFSNFFSFLYNAYLGRAVSIEEFGIVSVMSGILSLADIPINALERTITYRSAYFLGKFDTPIKAFWAHIRSKALFHAFFVTAVWVAAIPVVADFFKIDTYIPLVIFTPVWALGIVSSIDNGFLKGTMRFGALAIIGMIDSVNRFLFAYLLVTLGLSNYVYVSIPLSLSITFLLMWIMAQKVPAKNVVVQKSSISSFPKRFYITNILTKISAVSYLSFDVILAKHYLSAVEAGEYALLSLVGKMVFFAGSLFAQFINPIVSKHEGAGRSSKKVFYQIMALTAISSLSAYVILGQFGYLTIPYLFGGKAQPIIYLLPVYTIAMVAFTIGSNIVIFHQIKKHTIFPITSFVLSAVQIGMIVLHHTDVKTIAIVMSVLCAVYFVTVLTMHIFYTWIAIVLRNIYEFFDFFKKLPFSVDNKTQNILIMNWRDTKHMWGGGAENYLHEIAKEWIRLGYTVTIFCGNDGKMPRNEVFEDIHIIRRGGFYTVYFWAAIYYMFKFRNVFDVLIDSENGIPFFTPLYARIPTFLLIHHIHQDVFREHLRFPFSVLATFLEGKIMPFIYKNAQIITVSESSKRDIVKLGFTNTQNISIIHPGIHYKSSSILKKTSYPQFAYLGRLKPYKNVDIAIKAFAEIVLEYPAARLIIAGEGESLKSLKKLAQTLHVEKNVDFLGKITEKEKKNLLGQSWAALQPSQIEGWGITVIESNAFGTPVIASNVNGLKDSVVNGKTGILVQVGNVKQFFVAMQIVITDTRFRNRLSKNALEWSQNFRWTNSAQKFIKLFEKEWKEKGMRNFYGKISLGSVQ